MYAADATFIFSEFKSKNISNKIQGILNLAND